MAGTQYNAILVPGPAGVGEDGTDGADGISSITTLAAPFTMPAYGTFSNATVVSSAGFSEGQMVHVQFLGYLQAVAIVNATTMTLLNPANAVEYATNFAPGTVAPVGSQVAPGGTQGPAGTLTGAAGGDLAGTYPNPTLDILTTKGDLLGYSSLHTRLAVGTNTHVLHCDSAQAMGLVYRAIDLSGSNTAVSGQVPIANGGTGQATKTAAYDALSPLTTQGDIAYHNGSNVVRLAAGTSGHVLKTQGAGSNPIWSSPSSAIVGSKVAAYVAGNTLFSTGSVIPFDTEEFDTGSEYDNGTYRFSPDETGYYLCTATIEMVNGGTPPSEWDLFIRKNGTVVKKKTYLGGSAADNFSMSITALLSLTGSTDYIDFYLSAASNSGTLQGGVTLSYMHVNRAF